MPPYYPNQHGNQYPEDNPYYDQFNQYQYGYNNANQPIPPYSQIQVNVPPQSPGQVNGASQAAPQGYPQQYQYANPHQQQNQYQHQIQHNQQQQLQSSQAYQQQNFARYQNHVHPQFQQNFQPQYMSHGQQYQQHQQQIPPQPFVQLPQTQIQRSQPNQPQFQLQPQTQSRPQSQINQQQRVLQDTQLNAPRQQQTPSKPLPKPEPSYPEPDYAILLLSLADEYLEAASKMSVRTEEYFKMTATALGCLESVLQNFKLPPLREAQVGLRYAHLLYTETDNNDNAETILTKTIELCERMKFIDLKYAAQLLLAQVLHRSNVKAAIKDLRSIIQDIETYKHSAWEYAFRLQLVSFYMASSMPNDIHAATTQLERLGHSAKQTGDNTMYAFAATLETLTALQSPNADSTQVAQRALAKARALQLNDEVSGNPQITIMMEFLDLCIHIKDSDIAQGEPKRKIMQSVLYSVLENPNWRSDGLMYIPVSRSSLRSLQTQENGIIAERNGKYYLALTWLTKEEVEDLGYLLSGVSAAFKNAGDNGKAEKFFEEGLDMLKDMAKERRSVNSKGEAMRDRRLVTETHFLLERVLLQCSKGQWSKAEATLNMIEKIASEMTGRYPSEMVFLTDYVKGAIAQGQGKIDEALKIFASQIQRLQPQTSPNPDSRRSVAPRKEEVYRNIAMLAAMNTIFIIQYNSHPQHYRLQQLVNMLDPLVHSSGNKTIQAAWNLILAILPSNSILKTKQYLSYALNAAQAMNNAQVTTLCLTAMQDRFFQGVVGEQAIKCARAATHQAKKLNEPMWISVTTGLEAQCLDVHGMREEAAKKREESLQVTKSLPEKVQQG